jgi:nucleoside-triphosphatase
VGRYRVDVSAFEQIGVKGLEDAVMTSDVILVDEIGKMELFSRRFREVVLSALDVAKPVIATVMARGHPFVDALKARPDVQLLEVTLDSRDRLADQLAKQMTTEASRGGGSFASAER